MNEVEAFTTLLSNSPLAAAVLFLGYKAKNALERFAKALEDIVSAHKESAVAQSSHGEQLEENTQALIENTQARKATNPTEKS